MYNRKYARAHYSGSDFNGETNTVETVPEAVTLKINLLKDGLHLKQNDEREPIVREILGRCKTASEIDNLLHDIVRFNETIDEFIARKGAQNV